ncbi:MAG: hypothetical protein QOE82_621 [Thermoanaerobaculia bacterium]|jgi:hypothetical protein|nr:hypothetical protein [Thermoanaerobaculia bacterium]
MFLLIRWLIFLCAVALVFYFYKYQFGTRDYGTKSLDGRCFYAPASVDGILGQIDKAGKLALYYETETTIDLIFPMVYGLMFVTAIIGMIPGAGAPRWLVVLPVLTVIGDYCENATVIAMLKRYPNSLGFLPNIACLASGTKGICLLGSTLVVVGLAIVWIVKRF